jgi:hypothetical protein
MITTQDYTHELMLNYVTRERYLRPLSKKEIFDLIDSKYSDDESVFKLEAMEKAGLSLEVIVLLALSKEG